VTRPSEHQLACATLTRLAEPAHPLLGALLQLLPPAEVLAAIRFGTLPAAADALDPDQVTGLRPALARWQARLPAIHAATDMAKYAACGIRLVCPGEPGWPAHLDDLGGARPYALWVRGPADLQACTGQSVAIIGARAATAYGVHVCTGLAATLAGSGWTIISGGAYGIDAAAHRAALTAGAATIAVLACGPDIPHPRQHHDLLATIAYRGAVISEHPPGTPVSRQRLLARNRIITALAAGTVVVEAAVRGGTISAARLADDLGRPLMAVPGPVTSAASAGCHQLIRDLSAACVTSAADITSEIPPF
jgi:DNA processing protein